MCMVVMKLFGRDFVTLRDRVINIIELTIVRFNWMAENVMKSNKRVWVIEKDIVNSVIFATP